MGDRLRIPARTGHCAAVLNIMGHEREKGGLEREPGLGVTPIRNAYPGRAARGTGERAYATHVARRTVRVVAYEEEPAVTADVSVVR